MKRTITRLASLLLALLLLCSLGGVMAEEEPGAQETAEETELSALEKAEALNALGLFRGKGTLEDGRADYALSDASNRSEAATMLIRLLGKEAKASSQMAAGILRSPFTDVPSWAEANVAWLYENGYVNGTGPDAYNGAGSVTAQQFAAMILRSLGYRESDGDFTYARALDFAVEKGLLTPEQRSAWERDFRREGMAVMCYNALYLHMRQSDLTLYDKLRNDGVFRPVPSAPAPGKPLSLSLKYSGGGSIDPWNVEEPVSTSPLCADLDGDGSMEILFTFRSLYCLDGATGKIKWFVPSGHDVTEGLTEMNFYSPDYKGFGAPVLTPRLVDVDGDGKEEIVTFHNDKTRTFVGVYDASGRFRSHFTTQDRAVAAKVADLDGDGRCEFAFGYGVGASKAPSVVLYDLNGNILPGWPRVLGYGLYSDSIEACDLDGDGVRELVMLYDEEHVAAFHMDGTEALASGGVYAGLPWGGLPVCENLGQEELLAVWAREHGGHSFATSDVILGQTRETKNCIMGTYGGILEEDVDGDGVTELVAAVMVLDGSLVMRVDGNTFDGVARYFTAFILNKDRTRYRNDALGFDWSQMPTDTGEIIAMGSETISRPDNSPVVADLDGDGMKEILFSSHDGKMHCYSLDATEHGAWPYALNNRSGSGVVTFASRPVTADLNGDGRQEVVFTTYTEDDQTQVRGCLYVLSDSGSLLAQETLPPWWGYEGEGDIYYADGSKASPCAADVDGDGKPEIVVTTLSCGICVYDVE